MLGFGSLRHRHPAARGAGPRPRPRARRLVATVVVLAAAVLAQTAGLAPAPALAASSPVALAIDGQHIVFGTTALEGTIYLSQNGYDYINPGFDFESGKETSGLNATPDLAIQTGLASPYAVVGALGVAALGATSATVATGRSIVPRVNETLVVLDAKGRYVLVQIQAVSPNALSFAYTFGTAQSQPASLGNAVWVLGHQLTFPGTAMRGQVMLSGNGEVSVSPGFDFELDRQVSTLHQDAGLTAGIDASGRLAIAGNLAAVGANGHASAWPVSATVTPAQGSLYLLVDAAGNYVLVQVTTVSATAVAFDYRVLPAHAVPVLPSAPVTLRIAGSAVTFSGPPRYGTILASRAGAALIAPGFDLEDGREVSGLSANPDVAVQVQDGGVFLSGTLATFNQLSAGRGPSVSDVAAAPLGRFVAVDGAGRYVLVGVESATGQAVAFAYEIESGGATAVLQPPNPATVPSAPVSTGNGTLVFSVYTGVAANFGIQNGTDPATGAYQSGGVLRLLKAYAFALDAGRIWDFAGATAAQEPALSPNGRWLATASGGDISVRSTVGPARMVATNGNVLEGALPAFSWSPDSRYLAYTGMVSEGGYDAGHALWVVEPSTGKRRLVVDPLRTGLDVAAAAWLPHDRLVFSTAKAFYEVSADWTKITKLPVRAGVTGQDGRFAASADGTLLTWVARDPKGHYQVIVATLDGKQRVQFTHSRWDNWSPQFSPDGTFVAYVAHTGPTPGGEIWALSLDGKQNGYLYAPGTKTPITHVFDIEQWYAGKSATAWKAH